MLPMTPTTTHPLVLPSSLGQSSSSLSKQKPSTPAAKKEQQHVFLDPLTAMSVEQDDTIAVTTPTDENVGIFQDDTWRQLESTVLSCDQNDNGKIQVATPLHYLFSQMDPAADTPSSGSVSARLAFLESCHNNGGGNESGPLRDVGSWISGGLTRQEFLLFVEACNHQLVRYWQEDQRVHVVKTTIQLTKSLSLSESTTPLKMYPLVFFLVTDLVSYFGRLVYDRLVSKCPDLKVNFTFNDVSVAAKELCKNWLYKIASIRELVPRFYLETALLRCYRFSCDHQGYPALIERLTLMVKGIADPLVAGYARAYLVFSVQQALQTSNGELVRRAARHNYEEFMAVFKHCGVENVRYDGTVTVEEYLHLFSPVIQWLLRCQINGLTSDKAKDDVVRRCFNEVDNIKHPGLLMHHLLDVSQDTFVAGALTHLSHVVVTCSDPIYPLHHVLKAFGRALLRAKSAVAAKFQRKQSLLNVLNDCWKATTEKVNVVEHSVECAAKFIRFARDHFGTREVDTLLGSLVARLNREQAVLNEATKGQVMQILQDALHLGHTNEEESNVAFLVTSYTNLLPLFDTMDEQQKQQLAKEILEQHSSGFKVRDPVAANALIYLAGVLADSVNALTIKDETRQISSCICRVIDLVDFDDDFERRLKFYTECRGKFKRLDSVQVRLVHCVLNLAIAVKTKTNKGQLLRHSSSRQGFVQACCAFAFITVPSISSLCSRLKLYLLTAQIAYQCHCFGQAEASLQEAVSLIQGLSEQKSNNPDTTVAYVSQEFVPNLFAYLLVVPDGNHVSLIKTVLGAVRNLLSSTSAAKEQLQLALLYIKAIQLLSVANWSTYPYHINSVDSNDVLLYGNEEITVQRNNLCGGLVDQVLHRIEYFSEQDMNGTRSQLAWALFQCIVFYSSVLDEKTTSLAINLWKMAAEDKEDKKRDRQMKMVEASLQNKRHLATIVQKLSQL